jgi:hypothetical protein
VNVTRKEAGTSYIDRGSLNILGNPNTLGKASMLATKYKMFYPAGIIEVDAKKVVANAPPAPYVVLPNQAGLIQLVQQGALTYSNGEFQIRKKIRFPAELYGANAAKFLLLKGVPVPDGDPGHSCVVSEETGQSLANPILCH